jgi:hypothetical protein
MPFDFKPNPDKEISASTLKLYKSKLNTLSKDGFKTKDDLLNKSSDVVKALKEKDLTKQGLGQYLAAIFYAIGRQDFEKDPRGKVYYTLFQANYTYSTKEKE